MSKPKIIIFDLLTALLDSWTAWNAAAGSEDTGLRWRLRYLDITFECGEYQPYEQQIATAAREAGLPQTAADALIQDYGQIKPWPEVPRVLQKLRERGYALGVITNCSRNLGHLAASSCEVPFDAVLTAEEVGFYKPEPRAYQAVLDAMGITAKDAIFVAGSPGDVVGARKVGFAQVLWHNRRRLPPKDGPQADKEGETLDAAVESLL